MVCGRYAASATADTLVETFAIDEVITGHGPAGEPRAPWQLRRYNIAPTDQVAAVITRSDPDTGQPLRRLVSLRWGLVPHWSKSATTRAPLINARLETVTEKPSFARAMSVRRCLLPADGYYEWQPRASVTGRTAPAKQPYYLHPVSGLLVMAGLYEYWRDPSRDSDDPSAWLMSTCIITTQATDDLGQVHDRMPVSVALDQIDTWLDPQVTDAEAARAMLHVPEPGELVVRAVSSAVNNVRNDGPQLIEALP